MWLMTVMTTKLHCFVHHGDKHNYYYCQVFKFQCTSSDCMIEVYVSKFGFAFFALNTLARYESKLSFFHGTKNMRHSCFQQGRWNSFLNSFVYS